MYQVATVKACRESEMLIADSVIGGFRYSEKKSFRRLYMRGQRPEYLHEVMGAALIGLYVATCQLPA